MISVISKHFSVVFVGALSVLAFAPFNLWMAIVSFSFVFIIFYSAEMKHGFATGFAYGLGMFSFGVSWVFYSLHDVGGASVLSAFAMTCVSVVVLSLFPAMAFYCGSKLLKFENVFDVLVFASLWVLFEWMRSWVLTGFPWLLFGHTLVDTYLSGVIPIFGTFGGSLLVVVIALLTSYLLMGMRVNQVKVLTIMVSIFVLAKLSSDIQWTHPLEDKQLNVAIVQGNVSSEMKWDESQREDIYSLYLKHTRKHYDSDIIVWPETAIPTYYYEVKDNLIANLGKELAKSNTELLTGIFTYNPQQKEIYNSLVILGEKTQFYNKQHLVPFGEFLPFRWIFDFFRGEVSIPMSDLSPGDSTTILNIKSVPVGVSICYEAAFGNEILKSLPQAQVLINITNDAWFGDSLAPHQHLQIAQTRSLETGRYMIRAANTGISSVINSVGKILESSDQYIDQVIKSGVYSMQGNTPFAYWGNYIIRLFSTLVSAYRYIKGK